MLYLQWGARVGRNPAVIFPWDYPTGQRGPCHRTHTWEDRSNPIEKTHLVSVSVAWVTAASLTDLMEELGKLHLHFLPLEHVILRLFTDWWDLVELPGHRIRFLQNTSKMIRLVLRMNAVPLELKLNLKRSNHEKKDFSCSFLMKCVTKFITLSPQSIWTMHWN